MNHAKEAAGSFIDIIKSRDCYMVGLVRPDLIFYGRGDYGTLPKAWKAAKSWAKDYALPIQIVSNVVQQEVQDAGLS